MPPIKIKDGSNNEVTIDNPIVNGQVVDWVIHNGVTVFERYPNRAIFTGGYNSTNYGEARNTNTYNFNDRGDFLTLKLSISHYCIDGAGAEANTTGIIYGGYNGDSFYGNDNVTRIDKNGNRVGTTTPLSSNWAVYGAVRHAGAAIGANAIFYGGNHLEPGNSNNAGKVVRINSGGSLVGTISYITNHNSQLAGAPIRSATIGIFYAGSLAKGSPSTGYYNNAVVKINSSGSKVGSTTFLGTERNSLGGAGVGNTAIFYGGKTNPSDRYNTVTRINSSGAMVGNEKNLGSSRYDIAGAGINNAIFYSGNRNGSYSSHVTVLKENGDLFASETQLNYTAKFTEMSGVGL